MILTRGSDAGHLDADDDTVAAGAALDVLRLGLGRRARILVAAAGATAVDADAIALAGDAVALAGARRAVRGGGAVAGDRRAGAGAAGAVREAGASRGAVVGTEVVDDVLGVLVLVVDTGLGEAGAQLILVKVDDVAGGVGRHGLGGLDLGDREGAALGDVAGARSLGRAGLGRLAARGRGLGGRSLGGLGSLGGIEDVEGAASGGLDGRLLAGVVRDVVAVDDVVVPVALASLDGGGLEAEGALPRTLGRALVLGKGELTSVAVPGTEKVDGLDARRNTEGERKSGRHFD
jgi:hypothetical protein